MSSSNPLEIVAEKINADDEVVEYSTEVSKKITELLEATAKSEIKTLTYYLKLGKILLEAKIKLDTRFKKLIVDAEVISVKQIQRYIKLCLDRDSESKYGFIPTKVREVP